MLALLWFTWIHAASWAPLGPTQDAILALHGCEIETVKMAEAATFLSTPSSLRGGAIDPRQRAALLDALASCLSQQILRIRELPEAWRFEVTSHLAEIALQLADTDAPFNFRFNARFQNVLLDLVEVSAIPLPAEDVEARMQAIRLFSSATHLMHQGEFETLPPAPRIRDIAHTLGATNSFHEAVFLHANHQSTAAQIEMIDMLKSLGPMSGRPADAPVRQTAFHLWAGLSRLPTLDRSVEHALRGLLKSPGHELASIDLITYAPILGHKLQLEVDFQAVQAVGIPSMARAWIEATQTTDPAEEQSIYERTRQMVGDRTRQSFEQALRAPLPRSEAEITRAIAAVRFLDQIEAQDSPARDAAVRWLKPSPSKEFRFLQANLRQEALRVLQDQSHWSPEIQLAVARMATSDPRESLRFQALAAIALDPERLRGEALTFFLHNLRPESFNLAGADAEDIKAVRTLVERARTRGKMGLVESKFLLRGRRCPRDYAHLKLVKPEER